MKYKYIIKTQAKEWYGDEDHIGDTAHGRYKMKGGQDFDFEADDREVMNMEDEIIAKFNQKYDKVGRFYRYEAKEITWFDEPVVSLFVDGEITITFTDPLDNN